jgi:HSP20 family protein
MAEKQTSIAPARQEQRLGRSRPYGWSGSPFNALRRFADDVDRMFDDFDFGRRWSSPLWRETGSDMWAPDVDIFQKNDQLIVRADLPGLTKDDVSVEVTDNAVAIQGERKREHEEEREGLYRAERNYGSFYRLIPLPEGVITDQAKATFREGVLEVTIPAPPATTGRRLQISGETKK